MGTFVTMPDGAVVEMPDALTPEQAAGLKKLSAAAPQVQAGNTLAEIGRVADQSVRGGLSAMPGMVGDIGLLGLRKFQELMQSLKSSDIPPVESLRQAFRINPTPQQSDTPSLADAIRERIASSQFGDVTKAIQTAGGALPPVSKPQTRVGKALGNIGEMAVSTAASGGAANLMQRAAIGTGSGVAAEAAGQATRDEQHPEGNELARIAAALVGGGATGAYQAWKPNAKELVQESTSQMTDSDWAKSKVLKQLMEKYSLPNLNSQLLGPRSTLDDVVTQASGNPSVRPKLITAVEGTQKASRVALDDMVNQKLPITLGDRSAALDDIQQAATGHIDALKDAAQSAYVGKMPPTDLEYTPEHVQGLYQQLVDLAKSPKYGENSPQGKALLKFAGQLVKSGGEPAIAADGSTVPSMITNAHEINNLIKGPNLKALADEGYSGLPSKDIKSLVQEATPEFQDARDAMTKVFTDSVNPANKSVIGQIADMGGGVRPDKVTAKDSAINLIFNNGNKTGDIVKLADAVGGDNVGAMLREHLSKTMQKVWPSELGRTEGTIQAPSKLVDALAGQSWQRQNLDAALKVSAEAQGLNPNEVRRGFYQLMKSFETYKDLRLAPGESPAQVTQVASKNLPGAIAEPFGTARRIFGARATTATYDKIASMVMAPDGLEQLQKIAQQPKPERIKAFITSIVTQAQQEQRKEGEDK